MNEEGVVSQIIHGIALHTGRMAAVLLAGAVLFCAAPESVYASAAPTESAAPAQGSSTAQDSSAAQTDASGTPAPEAPPEVSTNAIAGWPQGEDCKSLTACLIDADTGAVLYDKSIGAKMAPASITKVMTLLLALENGNLEDRVAMTETGVRYAETGSMNLMFRHVGLKTKVYTPFVCGSFTELFCIQPTIWRRSSENISEEVPSITLSR